MRKLPEDKLTERYKKKPAKPKPDPLGSGMLKRAKDLLKGRKKRIDDAIEEADK